MHVSSCNPSRSLSPHRLCGRPDPPCVWCGRHHGHIKRLRGSSSFRCRAGGPRAGRETFWGGIAAHASTPYARTSSHAHNYAHAHACTARSPACTPLLHCSPHTSRSYVIKRQHIPAWQYLHTRLCLSPVGHKLRISVRPALVYCTMYNSSAWLGEALASAAQHQHV